jgi:hypothetical protein
MREWLSYTGGCWEVGLLVTSLAYSSALKLETVFLQNIGLYPN